ncbi:MAG: LamG-like jellyroll fold domain-containing protein [Chitinophagales bacterium]
MGVNCFSQIPTTGLIAWYPFNGNADDESGFDNHAVVVNASLTTDRLDSANAAFYFDNYGDIIHIPSPDYSPFDSDFTISFWVKSDYDFRAQPFELGDYFGTDEANLVVDLNDTYACWLYWNGGGGEYITAGSAGDLTDDTWHHILFLRKDSLLKLYFDGALAGTHAYYAEDIGIHDTIQLSSLFYPFYGSIDDLAIYNRSLTDAEIDTISNYAVIFGVTAPVSTDAFMVYDTTLIRWRYPISVQAIKIEYSVDDGITWTVIDDSVAALINSYAWEIPFYPGMECVIKITDLDSIENDAVSDPFLISPYQWQLVNSAAPFTPRDGCSAVAFRDSLYLLGGWDPVNTDLYPTVTNSEVWRTKDGITWDLLTVAPWAPRHTFPCMVYEDKIWILGGDQLQGYFQNDVWNSADGLNWNLVLDSIPYETRMTHMFALHDDKMWIYGGQKILGWGNGLDEVYNDVWNTEDGINWNLITDSAAWEPRGQIENDAVLDGKIWLLGGGTYNGTRLFYNDVWNTEDGITWNLINAQAPWIGRQYHEVASYNDQLWVIGGYDGNGNRNDVWFSPDGITWHELKNTPWPPRHASAVTEYDSSLWVISGNMWNDVWRLNTIDTSSELAIQHTSVSREINIYPNPASTEIIIESEDLNGVYFYLIDVAGRKIFTDVKQISATQFRIDVSDVNSGIYFLHVQGADTKFTEPIIIHR